MKKNKKGISLIVLIISIIVIIILITTIMLTVTKDNSISNAKEATFKQDMLTIQDEYAMYLSNKYKENPTEFKQENVNLFGDDMVDKLPSAKNYKDKVAIIDGNIMWIGETVGTTYYDWFTQVINLADSIPIPKGFKYKEGTKDTGFVIEDENGNEFVWIVANEKTYAKDLSLPGNCTTTGDDTLPNGITDEIADVVKYGGFYIGRYEAGIPKSETLSSNKIGIPVSKKGATVWTNIDYNHAKVSAEKMISNEYIQTGLLTGTAWDTTCHWLEDSLSSINESASLTDSRSYGNYSYNSSIAPADSGNGQKRTSGYNEYWKVKNIYDLAGNVWEWTCEAYGSSMFARRGGSFYVNGNHGPVSYRYKEGAAYIYDSIGFRVT